MDRPLPQAGELWQHFKGNKYWIIGIVNEHNIKTDSIIYVENWVSLLSELSMYQTFVIKDSEKEEYYEVRFLNSAWQLTSTSLINRDSVGWVRPLPMFMEILSNKNQEQSSNYYRFTKIDI